MKNKIKYIFIGLILVLMLNLVVAEENKVYELKLNYDNGVITTKDITIKPGLAPDRKVQPELGYKLELISFTSEVLDSFKFEIPLTMSVDEFDPETGQIIVGGMIRLNKTDFTLRIPYSKNGKTINIYDPNNTKVLSIDVGYFAQTCSNNICEPHEDYKTCPQDCLFWKKAKIFTFVAAGIVIVAVIVAVFLMLKYKRRSPQ